ncbi:MAG TPA: S-adenosylmethionine synthetase N-terminal domain-containing protein, partial [Gammaproteobacteria bacterium]|nr:S-adenosylmethionine synthetase N-terminal domain-containing protein [Gammaproteobacteria bacterium]
MAKQTVFTSESVSEGHPDKIADQISDAVLDAILTQDPESRVACETFIKNSLIIIGGEITTQAKEFDWDPLIRKLIYNIGYVEHPGFDSQSCSILTSLSKQSPDIARGVNSAHDREQGAGDQGIMFGYATNETDVLMPAPITYAHRLVQTQAKVRKNKQLPWLRPDAKSQISIRYENQKPIAIDAIVLSTQHEPDVTQGDLIEGVMEEIIKPTLPKEWLHKN